ncbi:MAG TPA: AMP-binding protein [Actinomycetospora sp.]|jgi:long-chain acyl-CoA synthetase|uniref:AMP-binding protein n=1 Tax=Actinomycetospora sp. TaxID=1872135 RepID=UPI002F3F49CF
MTTLEALRALAPAGDRRNATRTIAAALRRALVVGPDNTAVVCGDESTTYRELAGRIRRLIGALADLGLQRGDRVAVLGANCHRYVELYLALPMAGYVTVPLNVRHSDTERRYALADSDAKVLFTDREVGGIDGLDLRTVDLATDYEPMLAAAAEQTWPDDVAETDLAGIFYTGGTTG